ncbi:MAG: response regulator [Bacteroidota bacterium]
MAKSGPFILIEDDPDDKAILEDILKDLKVPNKIIWFTSGHHVLEYFKTTTDTPFIIICDVNLPGQNGLDIKRQLDRDYHVSIKTIPFVFYSTNANPIFVNDAFTKMNVQGFFVKPSNYDEIKKQIKAMLDYWEYCKHPNSN